MTDEVKAAVAAERLRLRRVKAERKAREGVDTVFITVDGPVERWVLAGERSNHYVDVAVDGTDRVVMWDCAASGPQDRSRASVTVPGHRFGTHGAYGRVLEGLGYVRVTV